MDVLVTYDIETVTRSGRRRLTQVAAICERYGVRVQDSVFECRCTPVGLERFAAELRSVINPAADSVNVYRFDGELEPARLSLGVEVEHELGHPWIV